MTPLKKLLADRGLKSKWLAAQIGMDETSMSLIVNGRRVPNLTVALKIGRVLGVTVESLWGELVDN